MRQEDWRDAMNAMNDDAIERTLAALANARVPEGLEARVLAGAERKAMEVAARSAATGAWWRGAFSGAAVAMVCLGCVLLVQTKMKTRPESAKQAQRVPVTEPKAAPVSTTGLSLVAAKPCPGLKTVERMTAVSAPRPQMVRVESVVPTRRTIDSGLTAEERGLVRLARVANLTQLASLNPEERAKQEAQETAEYQRFFAKPVVKVEVGPVVDAVPKAATEPTTGVVE